MPRCLSCVLIWIYSLSMIHAAPRLIWDQGSCDQETTGHDQAALSGMLDEAIWLATNARALISSSSSISVDYQRMWLEMMGDLSIYEDETGKFHLTTAAFHANGKFSSGLRSNFSKQSTEALEAVAGLADGTPIATIYCDDAFLDKNVPQGGGTVIVDTISHQQVQAAPGWSGCHDVEDEDDPGPAMYALPPNKLVICPLAWEEFEELTLDRNTIGSRNLVGTKMDELRPLSGILMHELMHLATNPVFNPTYGGVFVDDLPAQPNEPESDEEEDDANAYGWNDCSYLAHEDKLDYNETPEHRKDYQYNHPLAPRNADNYRNLAIGLACLPGTAMFSGKGREPDRFVIDVNQAIWRAAAGGGSDSDTDSGSDEGSESESDGP